MLQLDGRQRILNSLDISRDGRAGRAVLTRHGGAGLQEACDVCSTKTDGRHHASGLHRHAVGGDITTVVGESDGILKGDVPGGVSRSNLAAGVADNGRRCDPDVSELAD